MLPVVGNTVGCRRYFSCFFESNLNDLSRPVGVPQFCILWPHSENVIEQRMVSVTVTPLRRHGPDADYGLCRDRTITTTLSSYPGAKG